MTRQNYIVSLLLIVGVDICSPPIIKMGGVDNYVWSLVLLTLHSFALFPLVLLCLSSSKSVKESD